MMDQLQLEEKLVEKMGKAVEALDEMSRAAHDAGYLATTELIRGSVRTAEGLRDILRVMADIGRERIDKYKRSQ